MDIFDQILENLELERELGTRTVEIDRALLVPPMPEKAAETAPAPKASAQVSPAPVPQKAKVSAPASLMPTASPSGPQATGSVSAAPDQPAPQCDIAFFTGHPLSPQGMEAMGKIFAAIRKIKADVLIGMNEECRAKVCVLLGSDALKKRLPSAKAVRGGWVTMDDGVPAIVTFSPDYIFSHFQEGSPRMKEAKTEMWNDIKSAVARI